MQKFAARLVEAYIAVCSLNVLLVRVLIVGQPQLLVNVYMKPSIYTHIKNVQNLAEWQFL